MEMAARAALTRLIKDFPQDAEPQVQLGLLALAERNFPQAIDILGKYRATGDARVYAALASAYINEKQFDQAHAILSEGLAEVAGILRSAGAARAHGSFLGTLRSRNGPIPEVARLRSKVDRPPAQFGRSVRSRGRP